MKILVYGAGVLGCNLARNLFHAGKDVTLLARGNWAKEIRKNGLRIKDQFSLRTSVSNIPVVTELIGEIFGGTKYKVVYEPNMEDYLLCHAAFVMPAAFACYKTDGDLKKLRGDTAYLNRLLDAVSDRKSHV